jgi:hypothetical protein
MPWPERILRRSAAQDTVQHRAQKVKKMVGQILQKAKDPGARPAKYPRNVGPSGKNGSLVTNFVTRSRSERGVRPTQLTDQDFLMSWSPNSGGSERGIAA